MPTIKDRRDATAPLPYLVCIKPGGRIVAVQYASNVQGEVVRLEDGEPVLTQRARKAGWVTIDEGADNKGQAEAWKRYFAFERANPGRKIEKPPAKFVPKLAKERKKEAAGALKFSFEDAAKIVDEADGDAVGATPE